MSDTPQQGAFWRQEAAPDSEGDFAVPTVPDIETPAPITVGDHTFVWEKGVRAEIALSDADGRDLGTVLIPYDPDNQPSEEEISTQAVAIQADLEHLRTVVRDDAVRNLAGDLEQGGTADLIIKTVADGIRGGLKIVVTPDEGEPADAVAQQEAIAAEAQRLIDDNLEAILSEIAKVENASEPPGTFWDDFARDILAHAIHWAKRDVEATIESSGHRPDEVADDEFERLVWEVYQDSPYVHQALLTLWQGWAGLLAEIVAKTFEEEGIAGEKPILDTLLDKARENLGLADTPVIPASAPVFDVEGFARVPNDLVSMGTRRALVDIKGWAGTRTQHPEFSFSSGAGQSIYSPSPQIFPSVDDAWTVVRRLTDAHADVFDYITAKMLALMATRSRDTYGDFPLTPEEILDARGIAKHKNGGHKPENIADVIGQVSDLLAMEVRAVMTGHIKSGKGRRGKKETVTLEHAIPLILASETVSRTTLSGERIPVVWNLRPGNWARELEQFTPQLAYMMQGILKLHAKNDAKAKRIGRYLIGQYRIRAHQRSWQQPYRICTLLEGAGIDIPERNGLRFRDSVEEALDVLCNPVHMNGPICIESWKYPDFIDKTGRGWFDRWLQSGVVIVPPPAIIEDRYASIGARRRRPRAS